MRDAETGAAEQTAVTAVADYWRAQFPLLAHRPYRDPTVVDPYVGTSGPACDGVPSEPMNAFYCDADDFLAWDENLMTFGYHQVGPTWVYLIIAHEWGHAIQARISHRAVSVATELQADCFARAALTGAAHARLLALPAHAGQQLERTLTSAADRYPWTKSDDHGDAGQRIAAFDLGARSGRPAACPPSGSARRSFPGLAEQRDFQVRRRPGPALHAPIDEARHAELALRVWPRYVRNR